jgi:hypothetical protein
VPAAAIVPAVLWAPLVAVLASMLFVPPLPALDMPVPPFAVLAPEPAVMLDCGVGSLVLQAMAAIAARPISQTTDAMRSRTR